LAGRPLAVDFAWTFITGLVADTTPATVVSTSPVLAVALNSSISATFSEAMDPLTFTTSTFTLQQGTTPVSGLVSYAGLTATFAPAAVLASDTTYMATITTGAKDLAGNPMTLNFVWSFTTSTASSACSQTSVALGSAAGFAVLAGSTVTNTGATTVTGDLGLSPGTAVTGFPPGTVVGTIHAGDGVAAQAEADLTIAYNDAAGRTLCPITLAGNLGGLTLTPGLYKSTSSLAISSGDLTLDAQGNASAVFIFQMASTLTTTVGRQVILAGGAQASNIFWQVGSSATLGTNSVFVGTIMADQSITVTTDATLNGRALARVAAVTLDTNTVTKP
jgi:ice-binding like protein/Big-like domain-containing protein